MRRLNTREIQECELEILKCFKNFCQKNKLFYVLCAGTLIGAVRHKGFIPWDDDIDVHMLRPDYERLVYGDDLDYSMLPPHIKICKWQDGTLNYPFIKLIDTRTKIDSKYIDNMYEVSSVWIDVFPIDALPSDTRECDKLFKKSTRLRQILTIKMSQSKQGKTRWKKILKPVLKIIFKPISIKALCKKIDDVSNTYNLDSCEYIRHLVWGDTRKQRIPKDEFVRTVQVEFEGEKFNAPSNYDEYLRQMYGDYMKIPPKEQQITHNMVVWIDE
jgi:lipopolysaccharide cholinephosphotransferase